MTIPTKVVVSLMDKEREYRLIHIALSKVTKFSNLGIKDTEGISKNRLCRKIRNYSKIKKQLLEEDRLRRSKEITLEYFN